MQSDAEHFDKLKELIRKDGIKAVSYGMAMVEYTDGSIPVIVCEDFSALENDICYQGAHPGNADEIAIGSGFADNYSIGDLFRLTLNGTTHEYMISGWIQSVNNNGFIAELTNEG